MASEGVSNESQGRQDKDSRIYNKCPIQTIGSLDGTVSQEVQTKGLRVPSDSMGNNQINMGKMKTNKKKKYQDMYSKFRQNKLFRSALKNKKLQFIVIK